MFRLNPRASWFKLFRVLQCATSCKRHTAVLLQFRALCMKTHSKKSPVSPSWRLHELVSQDQYEQALDLWEKEKQEGRVTATLYPSILRLCEKIGSAEAARAVRDEVQAQGWKMDKKCWLYYVGSLLAEGLVEEAVQSVDTSDFTGDVGFLTDAAQTFCNYGYLHEASNICHMASDPLLDVLEVEILGTLKHSDAARELIEKKYGDTLSAPVEVQVAMADCFSLTNNPEEAMKMLKQLISQSVTVPIKSLTLLMEAAHRLQNVDLAAQVFEVLWAKICPPKDLCMEDPTITTPEWRGYHLRAVNAAIGLQAFALRDIAKRSEVSEELNHFIQYNFFGRQLREECGFTPDGHTNAAMFLLHCFKDGPRSELTSAVKRCKLNGIHVDPRNFTWWTQHCGTLHPERVERILKWVFIHAHEFGVRLEADQFKDLLFISYDIATDRCLQKKALECVYTIKNNMRKDKALTTAEMCHHVMRALGRLGCIREMLFAYKYMLQDGIKPTVHTYHVIVDEYLREGSDSSLEKGAYELWRLLVKDLSAKQVDVALLNKLIKCCRLSGNHERAFFFLRVINEYNLQMDVETFEELLKVCRNANDAEKFEVMVSLAGKCLPAEDASAIHTVAAAIERKWKMQQDTCN